MHLSKAQICVAGVFRAVDVLVERMCRTSILVSLGLGELSEIGVFVYTLQNFLISQLIVEKVARHRLEIGVYESLVSPGLFLYTMIEILLVQFLIFVRFCL